MKKLLLFFALIIGLILIAMQFKPVRQTVTSVVVKPNYVNKKGATIKGRVKLPDGYTRVVYPEGSFQEYIRGYTLKAFGSKVVNYDGNPYFFQQGHIGVLDIDVPSNGLQQCADALIRLRSEYLWDTNQKDEIGFNFTSGDYCSWTKYAEGYRPKVNGNNVTFSKTATKNTSKDNFYKYLNLIFNYSGTLSLYSELPKINSSGALKIGDMLILGGSPGHVVMIADEIINDAGEKRYVLIQGNTPAQSVHVLKNFEDLEESPWYKLQLNSEISIPGYTFASSKFVRFK